MGVVRRPAASRRKRLWEAVLLSLLAHAIALPFIAQSPIFHGGDARSRPSRVSLVVTPRSQVPGLRPMPGAQVGPTSPTAQTPTLPPAPPEVLKLEPKQPDPIDGQVVSLGQPADERAPEKPTKYLSEKDSRVLKETRAKETSPFFKNALSKIQKEGENKAARKPSAQPKAELLAGQQGENGERGGAKKVAPQLAQQQAELPTKKRVDRLQIEEGSNPTVQNRRAQDAIPGQGKRLAMARPTENGEGVPQQGEGRGKAGSMGLPGSNPNKPLTLSLNDVGSALGPVSGGPMNDDLRGVEEGDETLLNSRSFRYAGFLNRVKETVGRIWVTNVQDESQKKDPTGQAYSYKDRRTVVEFTLDSHGELRDVHVAASCGVPYLDLIAVESFKKAERFPNPPVGLMDQNGLVRLPFAFTLLAAQGGPRLSVGPAYLPGSPAQRGF